MAMARRFVWTSCEIGAIEFVPYTPEGPPARRSTVEIDDIPQTDDFVS
jgi:hypothetical protein